MVHVSQHPLLIRLGYVDFVLQIMSQGNGDCMKVYKIGEIINVNRNEHTNLIFVGLKDSFQSILLT